MKFPLHVLSACLAVLLFLYILGSVWSHWPKELPEGMKRHKGTAPLQNLSDPEKQESLALTTRGFSALQVAADAYTAGDSQEFLTLYLDQDFPYSISDADMDMLRHAAGSGQESLSTPGDHYKAGMRWFFLALAETVRHATDKPSSGPEIIAVDWHNAAEQFRSSRSLGTTLAPFVEQILQQADQNKDGKLESQEVDSIITSHLYGRGK